MLTIDGLREYGADVDSGLSRCMGMEDFYIEMVELGLADKQFEALGEALEKGDMDSAFDMAHALKGVIGNLALTPIYTPLSELTEVLRAEKKEAGSGNGDRMGLYRKVMEERGRIKN